MVEKLEQNSEQQFDLNLIEAVKVNPVIYDRSHYNYKHFVRKAQVWKQISEQLGVPGMYWKIILNCRNFSLYISGFPLRYINIQRYRSLRERG